MVDISVQSMSPEQIQEELAAPSKGYENRAPYREFLSKLAPGQVLRIRPGDGESKRAVQFRIVGAAKETGINVKYGDDKDGDIIVWLDSEPQSEKPRRRRKAESADEATNGTAEMPEPAAV